MDVGISTATLTQMMKNTLECLQKESYFELRLINEFYGCWPQRLLEEKIRQYSYTGFVYISLEQSDKVLEFKQLASTFAASEGVIILFPIVIVLFGQIQSVTLVEAAKAGFSL